MRHNQNGFTLNELIIVLAIAAVFAAVALPGMADSVVRGDLKQAHATVAQALRQAKNEARSRNTRVTVVAENGSKELTLTTLDGHLSQTVRLPSSVSISSADATYIFNALGTVNTTGTITLTSTRDDKQSREVTIANLLGQITS